MIELFEDWGRRLLSAALVYNVVATIVVYGYIAAGLQPPQLLPAGFVSIYQKAFEIWSNLNGAIVSGNVGAVLLYLTESIGSAIALVLSLLAQTAITYVWLAVLATRQLPWPLSLIAVPLWVGAILANTVMLFYLIKKAMELIQSAKSMLF